LHAIRSFLSAWLQSFLSGRSGGAPRVGELMASARADDTRIRIDKVITGCIEPEPCRVLFSISFPFDLPIGSIASLLSGQNGDPVFSQGEPPGRFGLADGVRKAMRPSVFG